MNGSGPSENPWQANRAWLRGDIAHGGFEINRPDMYGPTVPLGFFENINRSIQSAVQGGILSEVRSQSEGNGPPPIFPTVEISNKPGLDSTVIDPTTAPQATHGETGSSGSTDRGPLPRGVIWKPPVPPPVAVYNPKPPPVVFPPPVAHTPTPYLPRDSEVAVDWGNVFGQAAQGIVTGYFGSQNTLAQPSFGSSGYNVANTPPQTVTVNTQTGKVTPCRRRRRRRLLTASDLSDIASLKAVVGGGAALNAAVVKAVRR